MVVVGADGRGEAPAFVGVEPAVAVALAAHVGLAAPPAPREGGEEGAAGLFAFGVLVQHPFVGVVVAAVLGGLVEVRGGDPADLVGGQVAGDVFAARLAGGAVGVHQGADARRDVEGTCLGRALEHAGGVAGVDGDDDLDAVGERLEVFGQLEVLVRGRVGG